MKVPAYELAFPPGATNLRVVKKNYEYPLLVGTDTFTRTGIDGAEIICPLFSGDKFGGEVLEGQWVKGWDANISVFTAKLDGAGALNLNGVAAVAGTAGNGWINGQYPFVMMDGAELTVEMEVPVDDTGAAADRDIYFDFVLTKNKMTAHPETDTDALVVETSVDESGLLLQILKRVNSAWTTIFDGSTYDDTTARATGTGKFTIWRIVFAESHSGTAYSHMHVYLKQADTFVGAEAATEHELTTSPYDISGFRFKVGYPAYLIYTQNVTYFNSSNDAVSQYVKANYENCDFTVKYDLAEANQQLGAVKLFDTRGSAVEAEWQRVHEVDHVFTGDPVLQNGLVRMVLNESDNYGLAFYSYLSATWTKMGSWFPEGVSTNPYLQKIIGITSEKAVLKILMGNSTYKAMTEITLKRSSYTFDIKILTTHVSHKWIQFDCANGEYGYAGNTKVCDAALNIDAQNTSNTDNFVVSFDTSVGILIMMSTDTEPPNSMGVLGSGAFKAEPYFDEYLGTSEFIIYLSFTPFSLVASLSKEAESATQGGGSDDLADATASGAFVARLDAQNEYVQYDITGITDLPVGTYWAVFRALDSTQVADDIYIEVYNSTDSRYLNEDNQHIHKTLTAAYAYYSAAFSIQANDTGDTIRIKILKSLVGANEIRIDYFLIIPIGNGQSFPQNLSHNALRGVTRKRRVAEK